jgi:hypothetical protein
VAVSHRHLKGETLLFVDGDPVGKVAERLEPIQFVLGDPADTPSLSASFRDWLVYRSALNADEVRALHQGRLLQASLEVYAPLRREEPQAGGPVENRAQSLARVCAYPVDTSGALDALRNKLKAADRARQSEMKVEEKEPIDLDPAVYDLYVGRYELAPKVCFTISREDDRLYFLDPEGNKAELLPESETTFFIRFPLAELTVTFNRNTKNEIASLTFSVNGREDRAQKID